MKVVLTVGLATPGGILYTLTPLFSRSLLYFLSLHGVCKIEAFKLSVASGRKPIGHG